MPIKLLVFGKYACFTRPEFKVERVSYDVITPSAARGILEAIHWKPAIRWSVEEIRVLKPIRFQTIRRNEVGTKAPSRSALIARNSGDISKLNLVIEENRQQRGSAVLIDVCYLVKANLTLTADAGSGESVGKHLDMFKRRARRGQCFNQPYLGTREFPAYFQNVEEGEEADSLAPIADNRNLGLMLFDIDYESRSPMFFQAHLKHGILSVPAVGSPEVFR